MPTLFGILGQIQGAVAQIRNLIGINYQPQAVITNAGSTQPIWQNAIIMGVSAKPDAQIMQHPLETGAFITDHVVFNLPRVTVRMMLQKSDYADLIPQINSYFSNAQLVDIHGRGKLWQNMAMEAYPFEEDPSYYDAIPLELNFVQAQFVAPSQGNMTATNTRNPYDTNTVQQGMTTPGLTAVNSDAQTQALNSAVQGHRGVP
jgi:hypothetical protein